MSTLLQGIRVLDLSRVLAGPWAAQTLGDFGAEVIKVERPQIGDESRGLGPPFLKDTAGNELHQSAFYLSANRNKKSVAIDFGKSEGAELVRKLAAGSDVLIENFKVGTLAKYGLDYDSIRAVNPRIIYCSITGFGQTGPLSDRPGYDSIFQAMSGLMAVTGYPDGVPGGSPMKAGPSITDIMGGTCAVGAICAALYRRDAGGGSGQHIDMAMLDVTVAAMSHHAMHYLISGMQPPRRGTEGHAGAGGKMYRCTDGFVILTIGNDNQFVRFCSAVGRPELATDARFNTHRARTVNYAELFAIVEPIVEQMSSAQFLDSLGKHDIAAGPVHEFAGVFSDPQIVSRELQRSVPHPQAGELPLVANPVRFSDAGRESYTAPPGLGEHTEQVLKQVLDLDANTIAQLKNAGVISTG